MLKNAYYTGIAKKASINYTIQPGVLQKLLRGITSSSTGSKVTRTLLAGLPITTIAKLLGAGWGTSAALGAGAGAVAWHAPKLSKKYRLLLAARDKGVPALLLDMVYYLDTDIFGDNPMDTVRDASPYNVSLSIRNVRGLLAQARKGTLKPLVIRSLNLGLYKARRHKNKILPAIRKQYPMPNTARLLAELGGLTVLDMFGPQNTGRAEALADLINHK